MVEVAKKFIYAKYALTKKSIRIMRNIYQNFTTIQIPILKSYRTFYSRRSVQEIYPFRSGGLQFWHVFVLTGKLDFLLCSWNMIITDYMADMNNRLLAALS